MSPLGLSPMGSRNNLHKKPSQYKSLLDVSNDCKRMTEVQEENESISSEGDIGEFPTFDLVALSNPNTEFY